jgi:uncharacterized protein
MTVTFQHEDARPARWDLLPFRFHAMDPSTTLLTNLVGEQVFVNREQLIDIVNGTCTDEVLLAELRAKHIIRGSGDQTAVELLAIKLRTRMRRLPDSTGLHIFVVTLRCEHTCKYCQVSRQPTSGTSFDMTGHHAERALDIAFRSPSPRLKIEFQGGEPLLNFPLIQKIVAGARARNTEYAKELSFVIASNLALLNDDILDYCRREDIYLSTSLDGPLDLHNRNRPRPGNDSWQRTVDGIRSAQRALGADHVSALMTTTEGSLSRAREIIDEYVSLGLHNLFLRPISPYGFALRRRGGGNYGVKAWLKFYEEGLDYILELNVAGVPVVETYAAIIAKKMFSNDDPGYVDLTSPSGIGLGALVYNYDGAVYASDEGRMLAEMGDQTFRLGHLDTDMYEDIMLSDALLSPLEQSITTSAPMCSTCAFETYCGSDPVFHHATMGDPVGVKPLSAFCQRNMGVFTLLLRKYHDDPAARTLLRAWAHR